MPTPLERYQIDLQAAGFVADPAQQQAVLALQRLYDALLIARQQQPRRRWRDYLRQRAPRVVSVPGLYFWGGVGRGKTYLVDNFYACLPFPEKTRIHFHRFMRQVHEELKTLKNVSDPLPQVARRLAAKVRVLCLDEFHVTDITDAMILSNLLCALFAEGVTLVATSNEAPDELYRDGLQRDRFLPAIDRIKHHMTVVNVDNGVDYRLRVLKQAEVYHYPLTPATAQRMAQTFVSLAPEVGVSGQILDINGRQIPTVYCADGVVWLDFLVLCNIPRAVSDYIELAQCYNTVLLSNVPILTEDTEDFARRLINLVDEFYDRHVKLVISAAAPAETLYQGTRQTAAFRRTLSRLEEMRSHSYLESPHLP